MFLTLGWLGEIDRTVQIDPEHPLFKDCKQYSEDEIEELAKTCSDDELVMALRSCLRYNVARIAGKWEAATPFIEDMLSGGMLALVEFAPKRFNTASKHSVMKRATSAIINAIEELLNKTQALAAPSVRTQKNRIKNGKDPEYLQAVGIDYSMCDREERDPDTYKRDVMEALEALPVQDEIDEAILRKSSWSKTHEELASELGVDPTTISRRRSRLYNEFLELTR
jgi:hypothetical protein